MRVIPKHAVTARDIERDRVHECGLAHAARRGQQTHAPEPEERIGEEREARYRDAAELAALRGADVREELVHIAAA